MSSASSKSAVVSIGVTALILVLAAQGAGFVFGVVRALAGGGMAGATLAGLPSSLGGMALAGLIAGAWIRARHVSAAGVAFLAALATGLLNTALNYFVGHDPNLTAAIERANVMPALVIGVVIGGLIVVGVLWGVLLIGALFAGVFRAKPA